MSRAVVIGGGIVGLCTAEVLSSRGHQVVVRTAAPPEATFSSAAAAVITPLLPWEHHHPMFLKSWGWYRRTIEKFRAIDKKQPPDEKILEPMLSYECGFEKDGVKYLEKGFSIGKFSHLPFATFEFPEINPPVIVKNHVDDEGNVEYDTTTFCAKFVADFCNTEIFLAWLHGELVKRGVDFEFNPVRSLQEVHSLQADVIFNCMGFDARKMFSDDELYHVRGQSMFIDSDDLAEPFFGIASGHHAIFKHRRGFYLGSYFLEGEHRVRTHPDRFRYDLSLEFYKGPYQELCRQLGYSVPKIDFDRIRRVNTGIRPYRKEGARVEAEELNKGSSVRTTKVIHNYGHGAHGWTVGYATSEEAVNIAEIKGWIS
jgi:D-amino-acid oxidase